MDALEPRSRLALLLECCAAVSDMRQTWRVAYPAKEMLFLTVSGTMTDCDDYENIAAWGEMQLGSCAGFRPLSRPPLRRLADWLAALMNRIGGVGFRGLFHRLGGAGLARTVRSAGH